jgi:hypothetical protein
MAFILVTSYVRGKKCFHLTILGCKQLMSSKVGLLGVVSKQAFK